MFLILTHRTNGNWRSTSLLVEMFNCIILYECIVNTIGRWLGQRFSNFFDHGPLFSSGIVGGLPHFRVATFALSQSGTGVRPFPPFLPLPPFPLPSLPSLFPFPSLPFPSEVGILPQLRLEGLGSAQASPEGSARQTHSDAFCAFLSI